MVVVATKGTAAKEHGGQDQEVQKEELVWVDVGSESEEKGCRGAALKGCVVGQARPGIRGHTPPLLPPSKGMQLHRNSGNKDFITPPSTPCNSPWEPKLEMIKQTAALW